MKTSMRTADARHFRAPGDRFDYNLVYAIAFTVSLTCHSGLQLAHWSWPASDTANKPHKSVLDQARSDASTAAEFSFMQ